VLLDAGGTLLHEQPSRFEIYAQVARARGLDVLEPAMKQAMLNAHDSLPREIGPHFRYSSGWFEAFLENVFVDQLGLEPGRLGPLSRELFARFEDPASFRLYPGALELVRSLRALGLRIGVVSNWSPALPGVLEGLGLARELDFQVISALERCEKPERAIFELALQRAGANPDEAAHVGDCPERDVRGAQALGILALRVDRRGAPSTSTADHTVNDLIELEAWMRETAKP
jgi:putative hydrolase of the HAD superfamily